MAALLLAACAGPPQPLAVKTYRLMDQERDNSADPMVKMEKARRLHGAVSMAERRQRLGQYYTVVWHDPAGVGAGPVEVCFEYRQGSSGGQSKRLRREFPASAGEGVAEFAVIGDDYFNNGKVLAWRASVRRAGRELAHRQSYLWD